MLLVIPNRLLRAIVQPPKQYPIQGFGSGNEDDADFSFVFWDVGRPEFQAPVGGPCRTPSPTCCAACSTSAAALSLWSHPFALSWYVSSFDCSVFLCRLLPLTWHIREAGICSGVTALGLSKALPSPWHPEQTAATGKKQKKRNQKSALYHTNSCKPWIIYRAELLWQVIRLLKGQSNLQTSHSLVPNCILFRISYHTSDITIGFCAHLMNLKAFWTHVTVGK